ncbi:DUF1850 domain-containing protein [Rubrobacter taiwanensis]|jgi:hypothetical protein|uniref:DUF1850 domain-containing protein n=1 Tax=Rubrobacter taiwanensis TaxID=185139 RepID=A0A4R1BCR5_9ACTN|nr:DUF1850 domain-containing protein [Rubrobacter taiwanensis]TCJ14849.1 DUF1850 domain-containing protein [Rubrobacter taiwanensis]
MAVRLGALVAAPLLLALTVGWLLRPEAHLTVSNSRTGEIYHRVEVREGSTVRLSWTHSIEKTPWVEVYEVSGGRFLLREARVKSFGAGVDQIAPEVRNADGWVILSGTGRSFPELRFFHSRGVDRELALDGRVLDLGEVPQYAPVSVEIRSGSWIVSLPDGLMGGE